MTDLFQEPDDATPLAPEEREGLKPSWITTRADLNLAEQDNIDAGVAWAFKQSRRDMLTARFALDLHKRMFGEVWSWAGRYRTTERNIGIDPYRVGLETEALFADARYWTENEVFAPDEIAVRLHHRLVFVHPFPNGNGRHARQMADLLARRLGRTAFSWGGGTLSDIGELRSAYVKALREADRHDYAALLTFARS